MAGYQIKQVLVFFCKVEVIFLTVDRRTMR